MRVAPDQSVLIFDTDTSGNWPLVRMRNWWTDKPLPEVLNIPAWSAADAKHLDRILVDIQVTPEGRYAVAFSEAVWMEKSDFLFHAPRGYVARAPETVITVIDLDRWQIVSSIHTTGVGYARVVNGRWIAVNSPLDDPPSKYGAYRSRSRLISIPDLKSGPECISQSFSHLWGVPPESIAVAVRKQNDAACRLVLEATQTDTDEALQALIRRGSGVEPPAMKLHMLDFIHWDAKSDTERLWIAEGHEEDFFRHWGEYPYYDHYTENPPFQSASGSWYGLYDAHDAGFYELDQYSPDGVKQQSQTIRHLLCGNPALDRSNSACGCRVIDASVETHALLAYCRTQHGDFNGMSQRQWLSIFRSDDLSEVGLINLPKNGETLQAIANSNGRAYVLTLEHGETLSVYATPD